MEDTNKKYPEGHFVRRWMVMGIVIFSVLGIPLAIVTDNPGMLGIGPALGFPFGLAIGLSIEAKYKKEGKIRPLTEEEKKRKKIAVIAGVVTLLFSTLFFLLLFLRT